MTIEDFSLDGVSNRGYNKVKKLVYTPNNSGNFEGIASMSTEAENIASAAVWKDIEQRLDATITQIKLKQASPIAYFMEKCLMDENLLAKYMGKWKWTIKKHLIYKNFKKISTATLEKYASVFNISYLELINWEEEHLK